jgi:uncharacterized protein YbaR (Trm112 family)
VKPINVDARRYAWCRSRALWMIGLPTHLHLEDLHGAQQAGQGGLLRFVARCIGEACAVALNRAVNYDRAVSSPAMRGSWALERLREHELWQPCWELIRGIDNASDQEIVDRCDSLMAQVYPIVGEIPNILTPEGQFPAIAMVRDWSKLLNAVGEQATPPYNWKRRS